jgi:hypothetical protein
MQYFIVRPFQKTQEVTLNDGNTSYKLSINLFNQFESKFDLPINVKQLDYYKDTLHQAIHHNGTIECLDLDAEEYNVYISKIAVYQQLEQVIRDKEAAALLPQTLIAAKTQVVNSIYSYAAQLTDKLVNKYATAERDRWASVILPEAESYLQTENIESAPNLVAQTIIRSNNTDTSSQDFKESLKSLCNTIIAKNTALTKISNHIIGTRGKWTDYVNDLTQLEEETEQDAITRILAIDWKIGWEMPHKTT